ncbi:MAG: diguanylate cyclase [Anaerolineales bacterium]|nr:diguanylate cyclase [Anaerolineales bacterium]
MARLSIYLLGAFQVRLKEQFVTSSLRTEKERLLLAYLAMERQRSHSRESLAELLWPERPEGVARTNLRQALLGVRRTIGDRVATSPFLQLSEGAIQFNPPYPYWIDTSAFLACFQEVQSHNHASLDTCEACMNCYQEAVSLYRGDFLSDFTSFDNPPLNEWVIFQREQFFRYLMTALQNLTAFYQARSDFDTAFSFARQQVKLAPVEESAHRQLMSLLAASGRRSAALEQYQTCREILWEELGVEPSRETEQIYERIKQGLPLEATPTASLTRAVSHLTAFVGREAELDSMSECAINQHCRLLTLVGVAGVGKSRLALQVANKTTKAFPDGSWFIDVSSASTSAQLVEIIARHLGCQLTSNLPEQQQLANFLHSMETLLILDGFDNLVDESDFLMYLLNHAPDLKILLTSRQRLDYQAACLFDLRGLPYPKSKDDPQALEYAAVQLFIARAQRSRAGFTFSPENIDHVVEICQLTDGNPLALELAASRLREFSTKQIASSLRHDLKLLQTSLRDLPEVHRSMTAALDQSWKVLTPKEQDSFRRLSLIADHSFDAHKASELAGASPAILASLIDKSLLHEGPQAEYHMCPLLKIYSAQKMVDELEETQLDEASFRIEGRSQLTHDALTNLPNRDLFWDRLEHTLAQARRMPKVFAVLRLDLHPTQSLAESYGPTISGHLLRKTAARLVNCVRTSDTVARLGRDEFGVVLDHIVNPGDVILVGEKILAALDEPFHVEGQIYFITPNIGVSVYPDDGSDSETLLKRAGLALARARQIGSRLETFRATA